MRILKKVRDKFYTMVGDTILHKWPMFIVYKPRRFGLNGDDMRTIDDIVQPGDLLLRMFEGYLDRLFIPGMMNHGGVYVGEVPQDLAPDEMIRNKMVIHAMSDGVICEDVLDFSLTDHVIILRAPWSEEDRKLIAQEAMRVFGSPYNFDFDEVKPGSQNRFYCTQLLRWCVARAGTIKDQPQLSDVWEVDYTHADDLGLNLVDHGALWFKRKAIVADDIVASGLDLVWASPRIRDWTNTFRFEHDGISPPLKISKNVDRRRISKSWLRNQNQ